MMLRVQRLPVCRRLIAVLCFLFAPLLFVLTAAATQGDAPKPDFFASFNGTSNAVAADGSLITPQTAQGLTSVDGIHGKAVNLGPGSASTLQYAAGSLLNPAGGAVVFWVKPNWEGNARIGGQQPTYSLFDAGVRLHIFQFAWLRADLGEASGPGSGKPGDIASLSSTVRGFWHPGDWWQVALSWNSAGWTKLYVDGLPYASGFQTLSTTQMQHALDFGSIDHFLVGSGADAAFCDLAIYRVPLTDEEVTAQYRKVAPLDMIMERRFLRAGRAEQIALDVWPGGQETKPPVGAPVKVPVAARVDLSVRSFGGSSAIGNQAYALALSGHQTLVLPVHNLPAGDYLATARVAYNGSTFQRSYLLTAYAQQRAPAASSQPYNLGGPLVQIDCAAQTQGLLSDAPTRAVQAPNLGSYREAGAKTALGSPMSLICRLHASPSLMVSP